MRKTLIRAALIVAFVATATVAARAAKPFVLALTPDSAATLTVFLSDHADGRAVVCCPGGGYHGLAMEHEGYNWAPYFNDQGITLCVLKYRMPHGDRNLPMSDAMNAVATVRDSARAWHIDPHKVGIMGSSAGGHLAATTATHAPAASRPDFQILFYPVITMREGFTHQGSVENFLGEGIHDEALVKLYSNEQQVDANTPPAILLLTSDDTVVPPLTNSLPYYAALCRAGVPAAFHAYTDGGHGFGFNSDFAYHNELLADLTVWLSRLYANGQ